jgi:DNA-directed RNA polymerase specialized sigma24 family protein
MTAEQLGRLFATLTPRQRACVYMYAGGASGKQVAAALDISYYNAVTYIARATKHLERVPGSGDRRIYLERAMRAYAALKRSR